MPIDDQGLISNDLVTRDTEPFVVPSNKWTTITLLADVILILNNLAVRTFELSRYPDREGALSCVLITITHWPIAMGNDVAS